VRRIREVSEPNRVCGTGVTDGEINLRTTKSAKWKCEYAQYSSFFCFVYGEQFFGFFAWLTAYTQGSEKDLPGG